MSIFEMPKGRRWWRKPKHSIFLVGSALTAVATIGAAFIVAPWRNSAAPQRHEAKRPIVTPVAVKISKIDQVCGRRPGDHATYRLAIQNRGGKTVTIAAAKLNIGRIGYRPKAYPPSNLHWHGCGDYRLNWVGVTIPAAAIEGQSIPFEVNLELPARSMRDLFLTVYREHREDKRDDCFIAHGAVTFYPLKTDEFSTGGLYFAGEKEKRALPR